MNKLTVAGMPRFPVSGVVEGRAPVLGDETPELGRVASSPRVNSLVHRRDQHAEVQDYRRQLQTQ